jgi:hypothetical protein
MERYVERDANLGSSQRRCKSIYKLGRKENVVYRERSDRTEKPEPTGPARFYQ